MVGRMEETGCGENKTEENKIENREIFKNYHFFRKEVLISSKHKERKNTIFLFLNAPFGK